MNGNAKVYAIETHLNITGKLTQIPMSFILKARQELLHSIMIVDFDRRAKPRVTHISILILLIIMWRDIRRASTKFIQSIYTHLYCCSASAYWFYSILMQNRKICPFTNRNNSWDRIDTLRQQIEPSEWICNNYRSDHIQNFWRINSQLVY